MMADDTLQFKEAASDPQRRARYLMSIACLVKDAAKHGELQKKAQELLEKAESLGTKRRGAPREGAREKQGALSASP